MFNVSRTVQPNRVERLTLPVVADVKKPDPGGELSCHAAARLP